MDDVTIGDCRLMLGDCREQLRELPDASVDCVVTDPPYELGFMGKRWDSTGVAYDVALWRSAAAALKPGAHLLAFGGARTYHRLACAIEDAGFEVRDQVMWLYGSGFPKSHNLDGEWDGWGTALKPAHEPIVVARKPLIGSVVENVTQHGTGAMNINGCRVETERNTIRPQGKDIRGGNWSGPGGRSDLITGGSPLGRWPANVVHDGGDEVLNGFPVTTSGTGAVKRNSSKDGHGNAGAAYGAESRPDGTPMVCYGDTGSAARFFYCAKASPSERGVDNGHPTVKPLALMAWLIRLVCPPGGTVLDPFLGSGTTALAALDLGRKAIGIERDPGYFDTATRRIRERHEERAGLLFG